MRVRARSSVLALASLQRLARLNEEIERKLAEAPTPLPHFPAPAPAKRPTSEAGGFAPSVVDSVSEWPMPPPVPAAAPRKLGAEPALPPAESAGPAYQRAGADPAPGREPARDPAGGTGVGPAAPIYRRAEEPDAWLGGPMGAAVQGAPQRSMYVPESSVDNDRPSGRSYNATPTFERSQGSAPPQQRSVAPAPAAAGGEEDSNNFQVSPHAYRELVHAFSAAHGCTVGLAATSLCNPSSAQG
jgi:hypothetical protein